MKQTETTSSIRRLSFSVGTATILTDAATGWTAGTCPVCGYNKADIDPQDILWCPACGYSKKGCYT